MNAIFRLVTSTLLFLSVSAMAGEDMSSSEKPYITASHYENIKAVVDAIDHETREVTLTGSQGNTVTFTVGSDVRNLDRVEVGDHVIAEFFEDVTISVHDAGGEQASIAQIEESDRADKGEKPEAAVMNTTVITATVEAINLEDNTFKLKGPAGNVKEFSARDPENLKRVAVGDLVVITITQAMGIVVKQPEGE